VAERAGVSVRSVFQHFDDLPALHTAVSERAGARMAALVVPVDAGRPLDERIATFVRHRGDLHEAVTPFRRAAQVHAPFSPQITAAVARGTAFLRDQVAAAFAVELAATPADERAGLLDALATALSWPAWDALRTESHVTPDVARAAVVRTVRALLADAERTTRPCARSTGERTLAPAERTAVPAEPPSAPGPAAVPAERTASGHDAAAGASGPAGPAATPESAAGEAATAGHG
jgi:AcrR family transcriptional regulator